MNPPDIPCLVYNYLRECGYLHSAAALSCEAMIKLTDPTIDMADPGLLRILVGKGLAYAQLESLCLDPHAPLPDSGAKQGDCKNDNSNEATVTSPITIQESERDGAEGICLIRYPLNCYINRMPADNSYALRILWFGPSQEPMLSARFVVIAQHSIHLIDAETKDELASRALEVTEDLAAQAFVCPDGLTFSLVARLPATDLKGNDEGDCNDSSTSLFHFVVFNTVSLHVLCRYSLTYPTKSISMGNKWITCICDKQNNAIMIPRPVSNRSKSLINLTVHTLPEAIIEHYNRRMYGDTVRSATLREKGWAMCVFQSAGTCSGLSSYFYILQNEVLALYSPLGILYLYVPYTDNEDAAKLVPRYVNLYELLKLNISQHSLIMYKIGFIDSLPYVACLTNHGLAMINYRCLLYGSLCTQIEKHYNSWAYCKKLDPGIATVETGIWNEHGAIAVCSDNMIIVLSLETGYPSFTLSLTELQELHGEHADWSHAGCSITDLAFIYPNRLVLIVYDNTSSMIWCMKVFLNRAANVLESVLVYKGVCSMNRFIGRDSSVGIKRLYLSVANCNIIELKFNQSPHH